MDMPTICDCGNVYELNDMVESLLQKGKLICTDCRDDEMHDIDAIADHEFDKDNWFDSPY